MAGRNRGRDSRIDPPSPPLVMASALRGLFFGQEQEPSCLWSRSKTLALLGIGADVCSSLPQVISKHLTWTFLLRRAKNESRGIPQSGSSARSDSSSTMDTPSFSSIGGPRVPQSGALEGQRSRGSIGASARRVSERKSRSTPPRLKSRHAPLSLVEHAEEIGPTS